MEETLAIIGSGAIATGLAAVVADRPGHVLCARSEASAAKAGAAIAKACERLGEAHDPANIRIVTGGMDLGGASIVVEAVVENLSTKKDLLARLGSLAPPGTLIASTTSSLPLEDLATASGRPECFFGLHVFNPVPRMKLVELSFPEAAETDTRARAASLCERMRKRPVVVPPIPGYVVNRLLFPYLFHAVRLMEEEGLSALAVDECMTQGTGHPMGPIALLDYIGLDVSMAIGDALGYEVPPRLRALVAEGALGKKSGRGFHEHS